MLVRDILKSKQRGTITIDRGASLYEAMNLLIAHKISCLPVVLGDNQLEGIISDKDIFRSIHKDPTGFTDLTVADAMTTNVIVGLAGDSLHYIASIMTNNRIRHIPIVEDRRLVGLVSVGDVVKTQMESVEVENRYLKQYISGDYPA
jgi:CBS domain-containing protein